MDRSNGDLQVADRGLTDQQLLQRLRSGDQAALAQLFDAHSPRLKTMIMLRIDDRLGGRVSGSDVLQEVYIDALKRIDHFFAKPDMPFYLWLRLLASQRLVDVHRQHLGAEMRSVKRETHGEGSPSASSYSIARRLAAAVDSPSQQAMKNEALTQLEAALSSMDEMDREVLALRHFEELTNDEVAEVLGIKKAAASNRYVRALVRLKEILEKAKNG
jgi:RNA polymerase sigma-70 factor (ECF subfamily)